MRVATAGVTIGYESSGEGPAVIFLHAFPLHRSMWTPQVEALRGTVRTVALDFRGFGESELPTPAFSLADLADDVVGAARALGIARAVVVGLSMGGYVAFRVVDRFPEFVRALLLADTRAEPDTPEARARRLLLADRAEREGVSALADFVQGLLGPTTKAERPEVVGRVREIIGEPDPRALAAALRAMADRPDSRPLLPAIGVPTLVLVGEEDGLTTPDSARVIAGGIRGSTLMVIPRAGHLSNLEAPEAFTAELLAFVRAVGA